MWSELDNRDNKDKHNSTTFSKVIEFIGTLMEKYEADNKDSVSSTTTAGCVAANKPAFHKIMGKDSRNSHHK